MTKKYYNKKTLGGVFGILINFNHWTNKDLVGYEKLIDFIKEREAFKLDGHIVEIGVLFGGGTAKLAKFAKAHKKNVYAIDVFDPHFDESRNLEGFKMSTQYRIRRLLVGGFKNKSQYEIFKEITKDFENVIVMKEDSKNINFSPEEKFMFCFIDGNHTSEYVMNDFYKVWTNLVPGGVIGFHDYNGDIPDVTKAVDHLIEKHKNEIEEVYHENKESVLLIVKNKSVSL